jgi:hypothetical protein
MTRHQTIDAQMDEPRTDPGGFGPDGAGQSGDAQGLSAVAEAADESVEELADTGQSYEAEAVRARFRAAQTPD